MLNLLVALAVTHAADLNRGFKTVHLCRMAEATGSSFSEVAPGGYRLPANETFRPSRRVLNGRVVDEYVTPAADSVCTDTHADPAWVITKLRSACEEGCDALARGDARDLREICFSDCRAGHTFTVGLVAGAAFLKNAR